MFPIWNQQRPCSPGTSHGSKCSSALQHAGRKHCRTTTGQLRDERTRLLYLMQQVSDKTIVKHIRGQLQSDAVISNSRIITSLADIFNSEEFPPPCPQHLATCKNCGKEYDTQYNKLFSASKCRQKHDVNNLFIYFYYLCLDSLSLSNVRSL